MDGSCSSMEHYPWGQTLPPGIPSFSHNGVTHTGDAWQGQDGPHNRNTSQEVDSHGEESSKESNEPISLHNHSNDRPAEENNCNPTKEAASALQPLWLGKKPCCSF